MEGFTYSDIFATKGAEYLIVIAFLGILIPFVLILKRGGFSRSKHREAANLFSFSANDVPAGYLISPNHTWLFLEKHGAARIGFDPFVTGMGGSGTIRHLKEPGEMVRRGDVIVEIAGNGKQLELQSPVSGMYLGMNSELSPGLSDSLTDLYGESWICRIRPSNWLAETGFCHIAGDARTWYQQEMVRLRDAIARKGFSSGPMGIPVILQDGGEVDLRQLSSLPEADWDHLKKEFFSLHS